MSSRAPLTPEEREQRRRELLDSLRDEGVDEEVLRLAEAALTKSAPSLAPRPAPPKLSPTDSALKAALSHTFTIATNVTSAPAGIERVQPESDQDREALLTNSRIVMIGGEQRLQLNDTARAELLQSVQQTPRFRALLESYVEDDATNFERVTTDPIRLPSAWLRSFLIGTHGELSLAPPLELRAAVDALERLQNLDPDLFQRPSIAEARRMLELSELLNPLRVLIGASGGWAGDKATDRFVGRSRELRKLRAFVDELDAESWSESFGRLMDRGVSAAQFIFGLREEAVRFIVARGGLGKSALMAKFVLDHAFNQKRPFPFVYFDFDRTSLNPREPRQLLIEAARQISLQFPQVATELQALRTRLASELAEASKSDTDPFVEFRRLIRDRLTRGSRAFLVVLDTMEVVQYEPKGVAGVADFVRRLDGTLVGDDFRELKVVAAGRADIPELGSDQETYTKNRTIELPPLDVAEAKQMAQCLGESLLGAGWESEWSTALAGADQDEPERREPLTIRVAVELIRAAKSEEREQLVQDIATRGEAATGRSLDKAAGESFVGKLYQTRVLRHVQHPMAQKLAWPGLVVRHVSKDIIRDKLAPLCELPLEHVDTAYEALAREVWMVDRHGDELWHRKDLRARTLPLMRQHNQEKFDLMNRAAVAFYFERRSDPRAYAEWLYHRLLGQEDPSQVDASMTEEARSLLADAAEDFKRGSPQHSYLLSHASRHLLSPAKLKLLSANLAIDHLSRTAASLGAFDDVKVEPVVVDLSARAVTLRVQHRSQKTVRTTLLIKTGRWHSDLLEADYGTAWSAHEDFALRYRRARTVTHLFDNAGSNTEDWADPLAPLHTQVQDLALARLCRLPIAARLDEQVASAIDRGQWSFDFANLAALRLAAVFTQVALPDAAQAWIDCSRNVRWTRATPTLSLAEFRALRQGGPEVRRLLRERLSPVLDSLGLRRADLQKVAHNALAQPICLAHPEIQDVLRSAIQLLLHLRTPEALQSLRFFFAARDDDWIVPMGYAAARTQSSRARTETLKERLASHVLNGKAFRGSASKRYRSDAIQLLRSADDASDLLGVAHIFEDADPKGSADLRNLLAHHAAWREGIQQMLEAGDAWMEKTSLPNPPKPLPVLHKDDCQKDRWGGSEAREGRKLTAAQVRENEDDFDVNLIVSSTDGSTLEGPVIFHLHDTYPRRKVSIRKIRDGSRAVLEDVNSYGVYTVGVQVRTRTGRWTSLELDLATLPGLSKRFLER